LEELLVGSGVGPDCIQPEGVAILEPGGDLLDGGLLKVVGKRYSAAYAVAWQIVGLICA